MKYDVFISYSRKDYVDEQKNVIPGNVISKVKNALSDAGITYYFYDDNFSPDKDYLGNIIPNIEASKILLYISSENSNQSDWTRLEIVSADKLKKYIIPFRIDRSPYSGQVLFRIADLDYIDYYTNPEKGMADLVDSIKKYLEKEREEEQKKFEEERIRVRLERKKAEEEFVKKKAEDAKRLKEKKPLEEDNERRTETNAQSSSLQKDISDNFDIFISYSRSNLAKVKTIKAKIERATGANCWMDLEGIESGVPRFTKAIIDGIEQCQVFLFMRSEQSQESRYALLELNYASEEAARHVVIINIDKSQMTKEFRFLYSLTDTIDWNNQPQREKLFRDIRKWTEKTKEEEKYKSEEVKKIVDESVRILRISDAGTWQQIGQPIIGHRDAVSSASFSPDGKRIVSASWDKTVRIWDAETGEQIGQPMEGHTEMVRSASFSPDGKRIVSASDDKTIRIWDVETGRQHLQTLNWHEDHVSSAFFSPDGKCIVSASWDMTIRIWDAETGMQIGKPFGHKERVLSASFSPDGRHIVSASVEGTIRIWDIEKRRQIGRSLKGHTDWVESAFFSPDGRRIVSASRDMTVRIWDVETGRQIGQPLKGHVYWVNSASFSPDGKFIVSASSDDTIRIWNAETGQQIGLPLKACSWQVFSASFSPDGKRIVSASRDKTIRIWEYFPQ